MSIPTRRRPGRHSLSPRCEALEARTVLSALPAVVSVASAATSDSKGVTVNYEVENAPLSQPFVVAIYRASGPQYEPGDRLIGGTTVAPPGTVGAHSVTVPIAGGLPPDPADPYVVAVADPGGVAGVADPSHDSASFRTYTIGVVVHGGIQDSNQRPLWELKLAGMLRAAGYDDVIAFNWASQSNTPGQASRQGPRLAGEIRRASEAFPATAPVDLHLIGHSEGAVVVSQALLSLQHATTPQLQAGYLKVTLLDPHAANNSAPGGQVSLASGIAGAFAGWVIREYQARVHDPLVVIPGNVDDAEVYYQHTPVRLDGANHGLYNLWGQVPVKGDVRYADLTGPRVAHSGGGGVQVWYAFHVVPTLRDGSNVFVDPTELTARRDAAGASPPGPTVEAPGTPNDYNGTAAPGAPVTVFARGGAGGKTVRLGGSVADARGQWSVDAPSLPPGSYQVSARVVVPEGMPSPRAHLFHSVPVGRLVVRGR